MFNPGDNVNFGKQSYHKDWKIRDTFEAQEIALFYIGMEPIGNKNIKDMTENDHENIWGAQNLYKALFEDALSRKFKPIKSDTEWDTIQINHIMAHQLNNTSTPFLRQPKKKLVRFYLSRDQIIKWFEKKGMECPRVLQPQTGEDEDERTERLTQKLSKDNAELESQIATLKDQLETVGYHKAFEFQSMGFTDILNLIEKNYFDDNGDQKEFTHDYKPKKDELITEISKNDRDVIDKFLLDGCRSTIGRHHKQ